MDGKSIVSDGEDAGRSVSGSVKAICRRTGETGMSTPTISPMLRDQAPAAHTTVSVAMRPSSVATAVIERPVQAPNSRSLLLASQGYGALYWAFAVKVNKPSRHAEVL